MGLFDYVEMPEELAKRLGHYGSEPYQTKYMVEDGYLRVYNGFVFRRPFWETYVHIELLVKPGSLEVVSREPLLQKVRLEELGVVEKVGIEVSLATLVYNVDVVAELLEKLGFRGPREVEEERLIEHTELIGTLSLQHPVKMGIAVIKSKDGGVKAFLRLKSKSYDVLLPMDVVLQVSGRNLVIEQRSYQWERYKAKVWEKNVVIESLDTLIRAKLTPRNGLGYNLDIHASTTAKPDIDEKSIDAIVEHVDNIPRQMLTA